MKYIAFLRGINVGGHNVKMQNLRELFVELGFTSVRTFIQSGNVFFESDEKDQFILEDRIAKYLAEKLGYAVPTFVRTIQQLEETLKHAPFETIELTPDTRHMIVFISDPLPSGTEFPVLSPKGDFEVVGMTPGEAYVVIHLINGRFESSNFLEKTFGVTTTGRFYHTTLKILAAAKQESV